MRQNSLTMIHWRHAAAHSWVGCPLVMSISQCSTGMVEMGRYETGLHLLDAGVISGYDATVECVLTKLMFLIGHQLTPQEIRNEMSRPLAGEFSRE